MTTNNKIIIKFAGKDESHLESLPVHIYFVQQRKIAELQQHMHDQFGTNGKTEAIPRWFLDILLEEEGKLQ